MTSELPKIPDQTPITTETIHTHDETHRDFDFISPVLPMGSVALTSSEREVIDYSNTPPEYTD